LPHSGLLLFAWKRLKDLKIGNPVGHSSVTLPAFLPIGRQAPASIPAAFDTLDPKIKQPGYINTALTAASFVHVRNFGISQDSGNRFSSSFFVFNMLQMDAELHALWWRLWAKPTLA